MRDLSTRRGGASWRSLSSTAKAVLMQIAGGELEEIYHLIQAASPCPRLLPPTSLGDSPTVAVAVAGPNFSRTTLEPSSSE